MDERREYLAHSTSRSPTSPAAATLNGHGIAARRGCSHGQPGGHGQAAGVRIDIGLNRSGELTAAAGVHAASGTAAEAKALQALPETTRGTCSPALTPPKRSSSSFTVAPCCSGVPTVLPERPRDGGRIPPDQSASDPNYRCAGRVRCSARDSPWPGRTCGARRCDGGILRRGGRRVDLLGAARGASACGTGLNVQRAKACTDFAARWCSLGRRHSLFPLKWPMPDAGIDGGLLSAATSGEAAPAALRAAQAMLDDATNAHPITGPPSCSSATGLPCLRDDDLATRMTDAWDLTGAVISPADCSDAHDRRRQSRSISSLSLPRRGEPHARQSLPR